MVQILTALFAFSGSHRLDAWDSGDPWRCQWSCSHRRECCFVGCWHSARRIGDWSPSCCNRSFTFCTRLSCCCCGLPYLQHIGSPLWSITKKPSTKQAIRVTSLKQRIATFSDELTLSLNLFCFGLQPWCQKHHYHMTPLVTKEHHTSVEIRTMKHKRKVLPRQGAACESH
jgi:hypothetical protein